MKPNQEKINLIYQLKTFQYAFNGLKWFFASEIKSKIHSICGLAAIILGAILKISLTEWLLIAIAIGLVFITEILNTGLELLVDELVKEQNTSAGRIKDLAAGAVLFAAVVSLVIGVIVFLPKLIELIV